MGNHLTACISSPPNITQHGAAASDDVEGYSYSYHHRHHPSSADTAAAASTTFRWLSGASVSANTSAAPSGNLLLFQDLPPRPSNALECSVPFHSSQLQPSGPLHDSGRLARSGPLDRGSMSGPIFISEPLAGGRAGRSLFSSRGRLKALGSIRRAIGRTIVRGHNSIVAPITGVVIKKVDELEDGEGGREKGLHWAQGKAGEDRVHVVVWEEDHALLFVGIYDGFYGSDAPDYLLTHLYPAVHAELKGLLWEEAGECEATPEEPRRRKKWRTRRTSAEKKGRRRCNWRPKEGEVADHGEVLGALSRALSKTEEGFLGIADSMAEENPELGLMGSCVLGLLMRGDDVYLMNVGDSRALVARVDEEKEKTDGSLCLEAVQLTMDHSTSVEEEVERIRREHPDDASAVANQRVKGKLKVTRAFGAGFLKQPKWNNALIERYRIDYIGESPYITCTPCIRHLKLDPGDRFLILSSDGLFQYFTNQEAVSEVEFFVSMNPDGDPAQHLVEEALCRAADSFGLDFHELLQIRQGDRRQYHDDISVVIVSLEGRIWRYSACE